MSAPPLNGFSPSAQAYSPQAAGYMPMGQMPADPFAGMSATQMVEKTRQDQVEQRGWFHRRVVTPYLDMLLQRDAGLKDQVSNYLLLNFDHQVASLNIAIKMKKTYEPWDKEGLQELIDKKKGWAEQWLKLTNYKPFTNLNRTMAKVKADAGIPLISADGSMMISPVTGHEMFSGTGVVWGQEAQLLARRSADQKIKEYMRESGLSFTNGLAYAVQGWHNVNFPNGAPVGFGTQAGQRPQDLMDHIRTTDPRLYSTFTADQWVQLLRPDSPTQVSALHAGMVDSNRILDYLGTFQGRAGWNHGPFEYTLFGRKIVRNTYRELNGDSARKLNTETKRKKYFKWLRENGTYLDLTTGEAVQVSRTEYDNIVRTRNANNQSTPLEPFEPFLEQANTPQGALKERLMRRNIHGIERMERFEVGENGERLKSRYVKATWWSHVAFQTATHAAGFAVAQGLFNSAVFGLTGYNPGVGGAVLSAAGWALEKALTAGPTLFGGAITLPIVPLALTAVGAIKGRKYWKAYKQAEFNHDPDDYPGPGGNGYGDGDDPDDPNPYMPDGPRPGMVKKAWKRLRVVRLISKGWDPHDAKREVGLPSTGIPTAKLSNVAQQKRAEAKGGSDESKRGEQTISGSGPSFAVHPATAGADLGLGQPWSTAPLKEQIASETMNLAELLQKADEVFAAAQAMNVRLEDLFPGPFDAQPAHDVLDPNSGERGLKEPHKPDLSMSGARTTGQRTKKSHSAGGTP